MDWKDLLEKEIEQCHYWTVISMLEENLQKGTMDEEIFYLCLIYVYYEITIESRLPDHYSYLPKLKSIYQEASSKYGDRSDFLFYAAYICDSYEGAFIGLLPEDINGMFEKAFRSHPQNLLYQWGYYNYNQRFTPETLLRCASSILADPTYLQDINNHPLVRRDLSHHLQADAGMNPAPW